MPLWLCPAVVRITQLAAVISTACSSKFSPLEGGLQLAHPLACCALRSRGRGGQELLQGLGHHGRCLCPTPATRQTLFGSTCHTAQRSSALYKQHRTSHAACCPPHSRPVCMPCTLHRGTCSSDTQLPQPPQRIAAKAPKHPRSSLASCPRYATCHSCIQERGRSLCLCGPPGTRLHELPASVCVLRAASR